MDNKKKLTVKQTKLAQLVGAGTHNQLEAYAEVYNSENMKHKTITKRAQEECSKPHVKHEIEKIRDKINKATQKHLQYDKEKHFMELDELRNTAIKETDRNGVKTGISVAVKATELKGKLLGLYTEQVDVTTGGDKINVNIKVGNVVNKLMGE